MIITIGTLHCTTVVKIPFVFTHSQD